MMNKDFADKEAERARQILSINLRRYMELKNINVKELADAIKVPYGTVNDWYNAKKYPRIGKMERLAKYFNIRKSDLIEDNTIAPDELYKEQLMNEIEKLRSQRSSLIDLVRGLYADLTEDIKVLNEDLADTKQELKIYLDRWDVEPYEKGE